MIVDSSALIAILNREPEAPDFAMAMEERIVTVSAATLLEASIVAGPARQDDLDELLDTADVRVRPFTSRDAGVARAAYLAYGKGSGSPARLNMGDCCAYATSMETGEPLLFKGDDFTHTDVVSALDQETLGD